MFASYCENLGGIKFDFAPIDIKNGKKTILLESSQYSKKELTTINLNIVEENFMKRFKHRKDSIICFMEGSFHSMFENRFYFEQNTFKSYRTKKR
jgi:hypothetical protein